MPVLLYLCGFENSSTIPGYMSMGTSGYGGYIYVPISRVGIPGAGTVLESKVSTNLPSNLNSMKRDPRSAYKWDTWGSRKGGKHVSSTYQEPDMELSISHT